MYRTPKWQNQMWNSLEIIVENQTLKDRLLEAFIKENEEYNIFNEKHTGKYNTIPLEWLKSKKTAHTPVPDTLSPEPTPSILPELEGESPTTNEKEKNEGEAPAVQKADKPAVTEQAPRENSGNRMLLTGILVGVLVVLLLVFAGYNQIGRAHV